MTLLKRIAIGVAILMLLVVLAAGILIATFDANKYKPDIINLVKERYDRTLTIDGDIGLTLLPRIGASVGALTLSAPRSTQPFAKVGSAKVAVAVWPLLSKQVVVDRIELSGLDVALTRDRNGRTNFDDLIGKAGKPPAPPQDPRPERPGAPPSIDISGIALKDASVGWRDEGAGTDVRLSIASLSTGRIANGVPGRLALDARVQGRAPKLDATITAKTGYKLDFAPLGAELSNLDLNVRGDVPGLPGLDASITGDLGWTGGNRLNVSALKINATGRDGLALTVSAPKLVLSPDGAESAAIAGTVKLASKERQIDARLALAPVKASGQRVEFPSLGILLDMQQGGVGVKGKIDTPLAVDLNAGSVDLAKLAADLAVSGPTIPNQSMKLSVQGRLAANWIKKASEADITARFDETTAQLKLALADYSKPAPRFELTIDKLNVDRYTRGSTTRAQAGSSPRAPAPARAGEQPADLSVLKAIDGAGTIRIGALTAANVKLANLQATMQAAGGRLDVSPMSASLYQGTLAGAASINANNNQYIIRQQLNNVAVGPLLRDAADQDILEGRGTVTLDVAGAGSTASAIKRSLNGKAAVNLRDGAIKGINIADLARRARSLRSGNLEGAAAVKTEKTDFSAMTASFVIRNGVAHNEDLDVKSPFVRLSGSGDVDLGAATLNYLAKASVVATTTGQGGKTLDQARGITIPIRLTGPLADMKYSVDVAALAQEAATDEVKRRLGEQIDKRLGEGAKGQLGDVLKGILGR